MPDYICLPLTALNPELWQKPDLGRLLLYLLWARYIKLSGYNGNLIARFFKSLRLPVP